MPLEGLTSISSFTFRKIGFRHDFVPEAHVSGDGPPHPRKAGFEGGAPTPATWCISCGCVSLSGYLLGPFRSVWHHSCNRAQLSAKKSFHSQIWRLKAPNQAKWSPNRQNQNFPPPGCTEILTNARVVQNPMKGPQTVPGDSLYTIRNAPHSWHGLFIFSIYGVG